MPWWATIYIGFFAAIGLLSIEKDWRDEPLWISGASLLSNLIIIYLYTSYWHPTLSSHLGLFGPLAFLAALFWETFQIMDD